MDYTAIAQIALEQIIDKGRAITLTKLTGDPPTDGAKPWRGKGVQTATPTPVSTYAVFAVPNTSIPTESRGLGLDWIDQNLLKRARRVCIVPAQGNPDLTDYHLITDGGRDFVLIWGQCLKPGPVPIMYVFGLAE